MAFALTQTSERKSIDWILFAATLPLLGAGLVTMHTFVGESDVYFQRQLVWIAVALAVFFLVSYVDTRVFRRTYVIMTLFVLTVLSLVTLFTLGHIAGGAQSWYSLGGVSFQPSDPAKIVIILLLSKYFSRRHIEIANVRHIIVSGIYAMLVFVLVFLQPDFGSAIIILMIWFGMIVVSGISKKHFAMVMGAGLVAFLALWLFIFEDYQKQRIVTFINPLTDIQGKIGRAHV